MAEILESMPEQAPAGEPMPRLWNRDEYYRLGELGFFQDEPRVELIEGEILQQISPQKAPHASTMRRVTRILEAIFGSGYDVRSQLPVTLSERSEPEPDIAVVMGDPSAYDNRHPGPDEIVLVVEVADSSLSLDRGRKGRLYAAHGIAEYCVVNLVHTVIEVYRDPSPDAGYRSVDRWIPGDTFTLLTAEDRPIAVSDVLR